MPLTRITLRRGKSDAYLQAVSDSLHRALMDAFKVPGADRFQIIEQLAPSEFIYDRQYLGARGDDHILFVINAGQRDADTKRYFYRRLTECLAQAPGICAADVMVVVNSNPAEDWSFADGRSRADLPAS